MKSPALLRRAAPLLRVQHARRRMGHVHAFDLSRWMTVCGLRSPHHRLVLDDRAVTCDACQRGLEPEERGGK